MRIELLDLLRCPDSGGRLRLEAFERDGDDVEVGFLHGPAGTFPIVAGIPVLRGGDERAVELLRTGDLAAATATAVIRGTSLSRLDAVLPALLELRPTRSLGRRLAARRDRVAASLARAAVARAANDPDALLRLTHLENRRPNVEGYHYFRYRLGLPRHLVALAALSACQPGDGPVVEIGCGAGHLTWQVDRMLPGRSVIGVDRQLDLLLIARRHVAPAADLVCADTTALPLADASASLGVAVDVLSFVGRKATAVRELRRVVRADGGVMATSLINAAAAHEYAGAPLSVEGWQEVLADGEQLVLADTTVLDHYLDGRSPPSATDDHGTLADARTITVLSGGAALAATGRRLLGWPHAHGRLGLHPLLAPVAIDGDDVVLRRAPPSPGFLRDNGDLDRYLPFELSVPSAVLDAMRREEPPPGLDALLRSVVVLGHPDGAGQTASRYASGGRPSGARTM